MHIELELLRGPQLYVLHHLNLYSDILLSLYSFLRLIHFQCPNIACSNLGDNCTSIYGVILPTTANVNLYLSLKLP